MVSGILGKKVGMAQMFDDKGDVRPITVLQAGPCVVTQKKSAGKDGYESAQLGLVEFVKSARINKAMSGHFAKHNLPAEFVGHPVLESGCDTGDAARFRARHGLTPADKILIVMPGSRRTEVSKLLPILRETLDRLDVPVVPVVPLAGPVAETVAVATSTWPRKPILVADTQEKFDAFAAAAAALTKSGTSTLELALAGVPMVVTYRANPLTIWILRRVAKVKYASILNLLSGREIVPELLQEDATPEKLSAALRLILTPEGSAAQRNAFAAPLAMLRAPDGGAASDAAAAAILRLLQQPAGEHARA